MSIKKVLLQCVLILFMLVSYAVSLYNMLHGNYEIGLLSLVVFTAGLYLTKEM